MALSRKIRKWIVIFLLPGIFLSLLIIYRHPLTPDNKLEDGLRELFSGELGHTLIGTKPVSCEDWFWYRSTTPQSKEEVIKFLKQIFANNKTFILHVNARHPIVVDITLIHKPLLKKTIQRERYLNNFIKNHYGTTGNFFEKLQSSPRNIFERLCYDDRALGLVFGYGRTNSEYASRIMKIHHFLRYGKGFCGYILRPFPNPGTITFSKFCTLPSPYTDLPQCNIRPSAGFLSLEEELEYLNGLEYVAQEFGPPHLFVPPYFIAKRCEETDELIKHYKKSTDRLAQIYLEKTFSQFLAEQNT